MTETSKVMPGEGVEGVEGAEGGEEPKDSPTKEENSDQAGVNYQIHSVHLSAVFFINKMKIVLSTLITDLVICLKSYFVTLDSSIGLMCHATKVKGFSLVAF